MGSCSSCLGFSEKDDPEHGALLTSDQSNYNSHGYMPGQFPTSQNQPNSDIPNRQEPLTEREYLDRIVAQAAEHLIDIFAPPALPRTNTSATPNSKKKWFQDVLDRTSPPEFRPEMPVVLDQNVVSKSEREWLDIILKSGEEAVEAVGRVKDVGPLVVGLDYYDSLP
ncbi:hypothetical protein RUND412_002488 [Rhizina undulata]